MSRPRNDFRVMRAWVAADNVQRFPFSFATADRIVAIVRDLFTIKTLIDTIRRPFGARARNSNSMPEARGPQPPLSFHGSLA